jgi:predicted O-methyltransferase YrrM
MHIPTWTTYKENFYNKPNVRALEIGSFEGQSTIWIAENYCNGEGSYVDAVDTWEGSIEHSNKEKSNLFERFCFNVNNFLTAKKITINRGFSSDVLMKIIQEIRSGNREAYDFIYVDASHTAKDVLSDAVLAWEALRDGGILIFDDYLWETHERTYSTFSDYLKEKNKRVYLTPKAAIDSFLICYKTLYQILHSGYQIHLKKIANSSTEALILD